MHVKSWKIVSNIFNVSDFFAKKPCIQWDDIVFEIIAMQQGRSIDKSVFARSD